MKKSRTLAYGKLLTLSTDRYATLLAKDHMRWGIIYLLVLCWSWDHWNISLRLGPSFWPSCPESASSPPSILDRQIEPHTNLTRKISLVLVHSWCDGQFRVAKTPNLNIQFNSAYLDAPNDTISQKRCDFRTTLQVNRHFEVTVTKPKINQSLFSLAH